MKAAYKKQNRISNLTLKIANSSKIGIFIFYWATIEDQVEFSINEKVKKGWVYLFTRLRIILVCRPQKK